MSREDDGIDLPPGVEERLREMINGSRGNVEMCGGVKQLRELAWAGLYVDIARLITACCRGTREQVESEKKP